MYSKYYNFTGIPFALTPDSRFFFGSSGHSRAISHLVYGLAQQEGFIIITGEVGAGKTTLVEQLWSQLDHRTYVVARIVTTQVSGDDLLRLVVTSFGLNDSGADKATLLRRLERFFRDERAIGRRCLLVVDEVQNLSLPALEELQNALQHHDRGPCAVADHPAGPAAIPAHSRKSRSRSASPARARGLSSRAAQRRRPRLYRAPAEDGRLDG